MLKFDNSTTTLILLEIQFWRIQTVKNVIFGIFRDSELCILVILGLESCSNLLKSKFRTSKIVKINQNLISRKIGVAVEVSSILNFWSIVCLSTIYLKHFVECGTIWSKHYIYKYRSIKHSVGWSFISYFSPSSLSRLVGLGV